MYLQHSLKGARVNDWDVAQRVKKKWPRCCEHHKKRGQLKAWFCTYHQKHQAQQSQLAADAVVAETVPGAGIGELTAQCEQERQQLDALAKLDFTSDQWREGDV